MVFGFLLYCRYIKSALSGKWREMSMMVQMEELNFIHIGSMISQDWKRYKKN
jgi:hypothetical protein